MELESKQQQGQKLEEDLKQALEQVPAQKQINLFQSTKPNWQIIKQQFTNLISELARSYQPYLAAKGQADLAFLIENLATDAQIAKIDAENFSLITSLFNQQLACSIGKNQLKRFWQVYLQQLKVKDIAAKTKAALTLSKQSSSLAADKVLLAISWQGRTSGNLLWNIAEDNPKDTAKDQIQANIQAAWFNLLKKQQDKVDKRQRKKKVNLDIQSQACFCRLSSKYGLKLALKSAKHYREFSLFLTALAADFTKIEAMFYKQIPAWFKADQFVAASETELACLPKGTLINMAKLLTSHLSANNLWHSISAKKEEADLAIFLGCLALVKYLRLQADLLLIAATEHLKIWQAASLEARNFEQIMSAMRSLAKKWQRFCALWLVTTIIINEIE